MGLLKDTFLSLFPKSMQLPLWYNVKRFLGNLDPEIDYLRKVIPPGKAMIDAGANIGIYSYTFAPLCSEVFAFEPQPSCNEVLSSYKSDKIKVYPVALSSKPGFMELHIPVRGQSLMTGLASFREMDGEYKSLRVEVATLDQYGFKNIGFIKIDVEGHEAEVIKGGMGIIRSQRPVILIEMEQRYSSEPFQNIFETILQEGYRGGFLLNNEYHAIEEFSCEKHQLAFANELDNEQYGKIKGKYVCNFIFEPLERV